MDYVTLFTAKRSNSSCLPLLLKKRKLLKMKTLCIQAIICSYMSGGEWGGGAGKGGGSGGSIRDAGGMFGKMEAAREEEYFRKLQNKQLSKLKHHMSEEISHYKKLIQQHKDAIARLESRIKELKSSGVEEDSTQA